MIQKILFTFLTLVISLGAVQVKKKSVFIEVAKKQEISDSYLYPTMVRPLIQSTILSEDQGVIMKILTPLGYRVKRGQILATLNRLDPIYKFRALNVRSPIDGVVSKVFVDQGTNIAKGDPIFMVTNPNKTKLNIEVSAKERGQLKKGDIGLFRWNDHETKVKISGISPIIDPATGSATVELFFLNRPSSIPLGVLGQVSFKSNIRNDFLINTNAIVYIGNKVYTKIVNNEGVIEKTRLKLGRNMGSKIEVTQGLKPGDRVVIRSSGFLKEGQVVMIENPSSDKEKQ